MGSSAHSATDAEVFRGPPIDYTEPLVPQNAGANDVLRFIHVEERAGVPRTGDLVRVPLFFAPGECKDLAELVIVPTPNSSGDHGAPLRWQARAYAD